MPQDGHDPPQLGHVVIVGSRPKLTVIMGGAAKPQPPPLPEPAEESVILRSSLSADGRARMLRTLRALGAERGFLFVWNDEQFTLNEACACDNTGGEPLDRKVMWSLLDRITSQRAPLVMAGTDDQPTDAMLSGVTPPLRMAIAVPLICGEQLRGVACFDKRIHKGQFVDDDAKAAHAIMRALQLDVEHLNGLADEQQPALVPVHAPQLADALNAALSPSTGLVHGLHIEAHLAPASEGEAHFWTRHELETGSVRMVLGRLTNPVEHAELLVTRMLSARRAADLLRDQGIREQLHAMAFETERTGKEPYALHIIAIEWCAWNGTCTISRAGCGVVREHAEQGTRQLDFEAAAPFSHGVREYVTTSVDLAKGSSLSCELGFAPDGGATSRWVIRRDTSPA